MSANQHNKYFSSRWSLLFATLGIAVGTGNIWRFPRIAAQNGGGTFLIPWMIFLFSWSIPLIIIELSMGRRARKSPIGSFQKLIGPEYAWMGAFVGFCTMAIMFYYSVVMGWCIKYLAASIVNRPGTIGQASYWNLFLSSQWEPILYHFFSMSIGTLIISQGLNKGIERYNRIFIPSLFILLVLGAIRVVGLPGAISGIKFLFIPEINRIFDHKIWLEALSQSAWSTGAGWGLLLTYAIYMDRHTDIVKTALFTGVGDNIASLLAAMVIIPAVFAIIPEEGALKTLSQGNTGLTFIWMPRIFEKIPGGQMLLMLFFICLLFAALSSLIAMIELAVCMFVDLGLPRKKAVASVGVVGFLLGIPSAVSIQFFNNQDWTWSLGLMVSGAFFCTAVIKYGPQVFRSQLINTSKTPFHIGKWFDYLVSFIIPVQFFMLIIWWFYKSANILDREGWWNPFHPYSIGTCLFQWGLLIGVLYALNGWIVKRIAGK